MRVRGYTYRRNGKLVVVKPYTRKGENKLGNGGELLRLKDAFRDSVNRKLPEGLKYAGDETILDVSDYSFYNEDAAERFWIDYSYNVRHYGKQKVPKEYAEYKKKALKIGDTYCSEKGITRKGLINYLKGAKDSQGDLLGTQTMRYMSDGDYFSGNYFDSPRKNVSKGFTIPFNKVVRHLSKSDIRAIKEGERITPERLEKLKSTMSKDCWDNHSTSKGVDFGQSKNFRIGM